MGSIAIASVFVLLGQRVCVVVAVIAVDKGCTILASGNWSQLSKFSAARTSYWDRRWLGGISRISFVSI
jgi:hypothetical protein